MVLTVKSLGRIRKTILLTMFPIINPREGDIIASVATTFRNTARF